MSDLTRHAGKPHWIYDSDRVETVAEVARIDLYDLDLSPHPAIRFADSPTGTDDTAAIQAHIDALPATGGIVQLAQGVYVLNGTLNILDKASVTLRGVGAGHRPYGLTPTTGTVLKRMSGTSVMLSVGATASATSVIPNVSVEAMTLDAQGLATTCLLITSVYGGNFEDLHLRNATSVDLDITTRDMSGIEDTQACTFRRITIDMQHANAVAAKGIRLDSGSPSIGNTSLNNFEDVLVTHQNGTAVECGNCDGNRFVGLWINRLSGTGIGVDLKGGAIANGGHARYNTFLMCQPGAGGITARATGATTPSQNNYILLSRGNLSGRPTVEPGATLYWVDDQGGSANLRSEFRSCAYAKDDFLSGNVSDGVIGELGWAVSGGTVSRLQGVVGHPGVIRLSTSAASGTLTRIHLAANAEDIDADDLFDCNFLMRLNTNDANTLVRIGLMWTPGGNPPADGIYVEKLEADTSWFGVTRSASSETRTAALAACSTSWVKFRVWRLNATTVGFTVNDGTEVTATATVTSLPISPMIQIRNSAAADKTIDFDFFDISITGLSR